MELYFCKNKDNKNLNISDNIIIIGSSSSVLRNKLGENINQFKSIVRFNRSPIDSYEEYVGNRTDLRILNNHVSLNVKLKSNEFSNSPQSFIPSIKNSKIFLTQLEVPREVTLYCLKTAKENNCLTILNPAPASVIKGFFDYIDFFTPNETEAEFYTGIKITNKKEAKVASEKLLGMGIKKIVITLGEKGLFYSDGKEDIYLEANSVKVADTTGAGDAFNGGLAYSLSQNKPIKECLEFANKVAGASTTKQGAGDAMPFLKDLS